MHMEAIQRYVINMTEQEAKNVYESLRQIPFHYFNGPDNIELQALYETLQIWAEVK